MPPTEEDTLMAGGFAHVGGVSAYLLIVGPRVSYRSYPLSTSFLESRSLLIIKEEALCSPIIREK